MKSTRSKMALGAALFAGTAFLPSIAHAQVSVGVHSNSGASACVEDDVLVFYGGDDCTGGVAGLPPATSPAGIFLGEPANPVTSLFSNGNVTFGGQTNINGTTAVNGDIGFNGNTFVSGPLVVNGSTTVNGDLGLRGTTSVFGQLNINGTTAVNGDIGFNGTTYLSGDVVVARALTVPGLTVSGGTINFSGNRIQNVGAGVFSSDAATVGQLNAAVAAAGNPYVVVNGSGAPPAVTGNGAVGIGSGQTATGNGAVAIGDPNTATGTGAVAIGANNTATGDGAVAIGNNTVANGAGTVALGNGAQANAANSVALGGGSIANAANTVSVGAAGSERRIVNVANGTVAVGSTDAVNGGQLYAANQAGAAAQTTANTALANAAAAQTTANTAVANAATAQTTANTAVANAATAQGTANTALTNANAAIATNTAQDARLTGMDVLNSAQNARLSSLESLVGGLGTTVETNRVQANGGIAAAMALGGAVIVPDSNVSINFNLATYRGQQGFAGSVAGRVAPRIYVTAGVAGSTVKGSTGGRVGMAFGF